MFFNKGRELWQDDMQFREDLEEVIQKQLEMADRVQGFQVSVDVNSGFASLAKQVIERIFKDEAPKAPVYLYSVNNQIKMDDS